MSITSQLLLVRYEGLTLTRISCLILCSLAKELRRRASLTDSTTIKLIFCCRAKDNSRLLFPGPVKTIFSGAKPALIAATNSPIELISADAPKLAK